jgi:hypothetical protein
VREGVYWVGREGGELWCSNLISSPGAGDAEGVTAMRVNMGGCELHKGILALEVRRG